ncbi:NUDIX hydrolase [Prosthecochloris sp. N3]|uniref:NUDIX hydrolase n=1 Tax=Prosthecochloris ethylica TaxID=2743976 RepID=A0ABR9XTT7_9CHLB|nr:NUDIX hydrolase [Prosthecochloris ethylica]MBF0586619.1 NUDIX hydrolase [Prosthecochloris ethylica]MBF0637348.1 NUDIX hydrolase [Prosthecochloris ethylica]NUK48302.1 NUDIX hydrolase [Prosthecochloris ethylica]
MSRPQWMFRQSGVLPVIDGKTVLITTRRSRHWIIPKGVVERGMSPDRSAAKEAFEEAGLVGDVQSRGIGSFCYRKWGGICTVHVYPLYVSKLLDEWEESMFRKRKVVPFGKAAEMVHHHELRVLIELFSRTAGYE